MRTEKSGIQVRKILNRNKELENKEYHEILDKNMRQSYEKIDKYKDSSSQLK